MDPLRETPEQRAARMAWWREARFGLFMHWGIYAVPAGDRTLEPGTYDVEVIYGTAPVCKGNEFVLTVDDQELQVSVTDTGDYQAFQTFKVGTLEFPGPDTHTLSVKPTAIAPNSGLMDLHAVVLAPTGSAP